MSYKKTKNKRCEKAYNKKIMQTYFIVYIPINVCPSQERDEQTKGVRRDSFFYLKKINLAIPAFFRFIYSHIIEKITRKENNELYIQISSS